MPGVCRFFSLWLGDKKDRICTFIRWQMASLTILLAVREGGSGTWVQAAGVAGPALLLVATFLTVWSLVLYFQQLWRHM